MSKIKNTDWEIWSMTNETMILANQDVVLGLRCVVERKDYLQVRWDLNRSIRLRFAEEGITIPYEQLDVHISST